MSRAADYVVAMRSSSGSGRRATSNAYVTIVRNAILANTNTYIASVNSSVASKASTGKAIAMAMVFG